MRNLLFLSLAVWFTACTSNADQTPAKSQGACLNDPNSQCWCSRKCGYRNKEKTDNPIFIENDDNGKFCYCKQWDRNYYKKNCIQGKHMQQPANAQ